MIAMITVSQTRESLKNNEILSDSISEVQEVVDIKSKDAYYKPAIELLSLILKDTNLISQ